MFRPTAEARRISTKLGFSKRGLVSCVASEAACAASNPNTPGVNHWEDPHLCRSELDFGRNIQPSQNLFCLGKMGESPAFGRIGEGGWADGYVDLKG